MSVWPLEYLSKKYEGIDEAEAPRWMSKGDWIWIIVIVVIIIIGNVEKQKRAEEQTLRKIGRKDREEREINKDRMCAVWPDERFFNLLVTNFLKKYSKYSGHFFGYFE